MNKPTETILVSPGSPDKTIVLRFMGRSPIRLDAVLYDEAEDHYTSFKFPNAVAYPFKVGESHPSSKGSEWESEVHLTVRPRIL